MKLEFLGTGPNNPIINKKGKSNRLQSSILIRYKKIIILIDCTPSIKKQLKNIQPNYILITHAHKDAAGGLKYIKNGKLLTTKKLYNQLKNIYPIKHLEFIELKNNFKLDGLKITPFQVIHSKGYITYGYELENNNKIIYASDFKTIPKTSEKYFKNSNIAIVDGAGWTFRVFDHQSIMEFLKKSKDWNIKKIFFTQIGRRVPEHTEAQKIISKINKNAFLAWDGLKIQLPF